MPRKDYLLGPTNKVQYVQKASKNKGRNFWQKLVLNQGLWTIAGLVILGFILWPVMRNFSQQQALNEQIKEAQADISKYQDKNAALKQMIGFLQSDQAIEEKARMNLGLKEQGEGVIVITDPQTASTTAAVADTNTSNPHKWLNYFFN